MVGIAMGAPPIETGAVIGGRFRLEREIGRGSAAAVWRARDLDDASGRAVAIKLLAPELCTVPRIRVRIEREIRVLTTLDHPHIARIVSASIEGPQPFIALELVQGPTLEELLVERALTQKPLARAEVAEIFAELAAAVAHAHDHRVIHRDLKPGNVMLVRHGSDVGVKILDFGIAKALDEEATAATTRGRLIGTLLYMAPEQADGRALDVRTDVFALGVILFELLTLRRAWFHDAAGGPAPFSAAPRFGWPNALDAVIARFRSGPRPRPSAFVPDLAALDLIVAKATAIDPDARYPDVRTFADAVRAALAPLAIATFSEVSIADTAVVQTKLDQEQDVDVFAPTKTAPAPLVAPRAPNVTAAILDDDRTARDTRDGSFASVYTMAEREAALEPTGAPHRGPGFFDQLRTTPSEEESDAGAFGGTKTAPRRRPIAKPRRTAQWMGAALVLVAAGVLGAAIATELASEAPREVTTSDPSATTTTEGPRAEATRRPAAEPARREHEPAVQLAAKPARDAPRESAHDPAPTSTHEPRRPPGDRPAKDVEHAPPPTTRRASTFPELHALLDRAEHDPTAAAELGRRLEAAALSLQDARARERVRRIASSSGMVGDVEGLASALKALEAAR